MSEAVFWWSDWIASRYPYFYKAAALRLLGREPDADGKYKNHSDFRRWKEYRTTIERAAPDVRDALVARDAATGRGGSAAEGAEDGRDGDRSPRARPRPGLAFRAGQAMARAGDAGNDGIAALHAAGYYKETLSLLIALARKGEASEAVLRYATLPSVHRWLREPYDGPPGTDPHDDSRDEDGEAHTIPATDLELSRRDFARTERYVVEYEEEIIREEMSEIDLDALYVGATGTTRARLDDRLQTLDDVWRDRARLLRFDLSPLTADEAELQKSFGLDSDRVAALALGEVSRLRDVRLDDPAIADAERAAWRAAEPWARSAAPSAYAKLSIRLTWYVCWRP